MFLVNSRYRHFSATPFGSTGKPLHVPGAHLLPKLRCKFAEFLNQSSLKRLGILSPPTCVGLRYGRRAISTRGFSRTHGISQFRRFPKEPSPHHLSVLPLRLSPTRPRMTTYRFEPPATTRWMTYPSPSPLASTMTRRCRNINLLSITYAYRPRLRIRLTLGGLTWPRKPGVYGERVSRPFYRYSCLHKLFQKLHASFRSRFSAVGILSYHSVESVASVPYLSPVTFSAQVH